MHKMLIFIMAFILSILFVSAQQDWKLKLDKDGIQIYTSPFSDSKIKALKVVCRVEANLSQMAAVLLDINTQDQWVYNTKSSLLLQVSPSELFYYGEVSVPWPFSNRDFIAHIKISQSQVTKIVTMDVENVPDYISPKQDKVRVMQSIVKWIITPMEKNIVAVEFRLFVDPAGNIPSWLINLFLTRGPLETFKKLRTHLAKPAYANVRLPFIAD